MASATEAETDPTTDPLAETSFDERSSDEPKPARRRKSVKQLREVIAGLEQRLGEKDELVSALTVRLEIAARRLERQQAAPVAADDSDTNFGLDRDTGEEDGDQALAPAPPLPEPAATATAAGPVSEEVAELLGLHTDKLDAIELAVGEFGDLGIASTLGRLEFQLSELRDLVARGADDRLDYATPRPAAPSEPQVRRRSPEPAEEAASPPTDAILSNGDWESIKAAMFGDDPPTASAETAPPTATEHDPLSDHPAEPAAPAPEPAAASARRIERWLPEDFDVRYPVASLTDPLPADRLPGDLPRLPEHLADAEADLSADDAAALRTAIAERDDFIERTLRELVRLGRERYALPDWELLEAAPADLVENLELLQDRLTELLKVGELELSRERARIAREAQQLAAYRRRLQRACANLGLDYDPESDPQVQLGAADPEDRQKSRWKRILGVTDDG